MVVLVFAAGVFFSGALFGVCWKLGNFTLIRGFSISYSSHKHNELPNYFPSFVSYLLKLQFFLTIETKIKKKVIFVKQVFTDFLFTIWIWLKSKSYTFLLELVDTAREVFFLKKIYV